MGVTGRVGSEASFATTKADGVQQDKPRSACIHSQLHKTKICTYFLRGACQYGSACAFAHSCAELQTAPDLRKTRLCSTFMEGKGCANPECTFAHGEEELRSTDRFYKITLCAWNEKSRCRNGDTCRFAHGTEELRKFCSSSEAKEQNNKSAVVAPRTLGNRKAGRSLQSIENHLHNNDTTSGSKRATEPMKIAPTQSLFDSMTTGAENRSGITQQTYAQDDGSMAARVYTHAQHLANAAAHGYPIEPNFMDMADYADVCSFMMNKLSGVTPR